MRIKLATRITLIEGSVVFESLVISIIWTWLVLFFTNPDHRQTNYLQPWRTPRTPSNEFVATSKSLSEYACVEETMVDE